MKRSDFTLYDPFKSFSFKKGPVGNREFLTLAELNVLHDLFVSGHFLREGTGRKARKESRHAVLQLFLTSYYTGMRFGDAVRLDRTWFYGDVIRASLNKSRGKKTMTIPLTHRLREVLSDHGDQVYFKKPFTNTYTDELLVEITQTAKIKKHITFHCSRHTFACVGLEIGIPTEIIQQVLGHSNIKETQIYAKIQAQGVKDAMKAWDNLPSTNTKRPVKLQKVS